MLCSQCIQQRIHTLELTLGDDDRREYVDVLESLEPDITGFVDEHLDHLSWHFEKMPALHLRDRDCALLGLKLCSFLGHYPGNALGGRFGTWMIKVKLL